MSVAFCFSTATPLFLILFCNLFCMLCRATVYLSEGGASPSFSNRVGVAGGGGGNGTTGGRGGGAGTTDD